MLCLGHLAVVILIEAMPPILRIADFRLPIADWSLTCGDWQCLGARGEIRASHRADLKSAASSNWTTRGKRNSKFEFVISKCDLVPAEGFEPTLSSS